MLATTAELVNAVKRICFMPGGGGVNTLSDSDIVALANEELHNFLVPHVVGLNQAYYTRTLTHTLVQGTTEYAIPTRAVGGRLTALVLVNTDGAEIPCPISTYPEWNTMTLPTGVDNTLFPTAYVRGNNVVLNPIPTDFVSLRMEYLTRPGTLVDSADTTLCRRVSYTTVGGLVFSAAITTFWDLSGSPYAGQVDFVSQVPHYDYVYLDAQPTNTSTTSVTGDTLDVPTEVSSAVGAASGGASSVWVAREYYSPVVQLPYELFGVLCQRTAARCMQILGFLQQMDAAYATAEAWQTQADKALAPRVENNKHKILNMSGPLPAAGFRGFRRGWY